MILGFFAHNVGEPAGEPAAKALLALLRQGVEYRMALLIVLLAVATLTFVLSRCWAFRSA